jgi:tetratricopeptide (TPR) repeat protein
MPRGVERPSVLYWAAAGAVAVLVLAFPIPVSVSRDLVGAQLLHPAMSAELSSWSMPGASLLSALANGGGLWFQLPVLLCALLAFSLGCELESLLAGVAAAALSFWVMRINSPLDLEQLLLAAGMLLTGALLAVPTESPRLRDLSAGGAIAASLLVRGVLAPLPALLPLCGLFFKRRAKDMLGRAALLSAVPLIAILAWGCVQRGANGRFAFLEWTGGRADSNLITGALGMTGTVEGDANALAGAPRGGALSWAAGEAARHPLRFAAAVARRAGRAAGFSPLLFLLGLLGAARIARRESSAPVAVLAAYFLLFHCLMTVESRYFLPLWLLACPLAASCLGLIPAARGEPARSAPLAWLCFVPAAAGAACVLVLLLRFPWADRTERGLDRALLESPADADLLLMRGRLELKRGHADEARTAFDASYRLSEREEARFGSLLAAFMRGPRDGGLGALPSDGEQDTSQLELLKAFVRLEQGRDAEARAALARARARWTLEKRSFGSPDRPYEESLREVLRGSDTMLINVGFNTIFFALPKERRLALARRLPALGVDPLASYDLLVARFPRSESYRHDRGVVNVMLGRWAPAVSDLKAAIALNPDYKEAYRSLASACVESGDPRCAAAADRALLARSGLPASLRAEVEKELSVLDAGPK